MRTFFFILLLFLITSCTDKPKVKEPVIRPIAWIKVENYRLEQVRRLSGSLDAVEAANLSFQLNGKVDKVLANLGDSVKKGDALAMLDTRSFELILQGAQAQLQQSKANLTEAENEFRRYQELVKKKLVSQSGFDNAKAVYESAQSAVEVSISQLNIARKDLQDTILIAPYDGKISKREVEPSQQITAGQTVFEIEGEHGLEVNVLVPENLVQLLLRNKSFPVRFPANRELSLSAKIAEIGSKAVAANAFPVTLTLEEQDPRLRAGMTAEVDFTFEGQGRTGYTGESIKVPVSAISAGTDESSYVFVYDPDKGIVNKREVQTENIINNEIFISSGVQPGDIVATAGVAFLRDGQKVVLLDDSVQRFN
ncbi:efflux RND transporter periplasmic adaptor subunit [Aliikangiella sp. G2MR2-5]|uniref:efflux RND transporter periplasmic adaptor subunit n=1 Tax=Aliikangiella sp. G2MR2-5 TaxID=2788943 RepID=UPI0018ABB8C3|nr:efflux RND transporter periplasmic adaptor subunit [Aliikangiella sp. G2MR2-5]